MIYHRSVSNAIWNQFWEIVKSSFFTNYYFSSFFGSRILGLLHLLILIYLISSQFSKVLKKFDIELFLTIFLLLTYIIPITYSLIFEPILVDRYIFFVLIPILYLISSLTFNFENTFKKYIIIFLLVTPSFLNHFSENTFKQFYTNIYPSKPEIGKSLMYIAKNDNLNYSFVFVKNNPININFVYENQNPINKSIVKAGYAGLRNFKILRGPISYSHHFLNFFLRSPIFFFFFFLFYSAFNRLWPEKIVRAARDQKYQILITISLYFDGFQPPAYNGLSKY